MGGCVWLHGVWDGGQGSRVQRRHEVHSQDPKGSCRQGQLAGERPQTVTHPWGGLNVLFVQQIEGALQNVKKCGIS